MRRVCLDLARFIVSTAAIVLATPSVSQVLSEGASVYLSAQDSFSLDPGTFENSVANDFGAATAEATASYAGNSVDSFVTAFGAASGQPGAPESVGQARLGFYYEITWDAVALGEPPPDVLVDVSAIFTTMITPNPGDATAFVGAAYGQITGYYGDTITVCTTSYFTLGCGATPYIGFRDVGAYDEAIGVVIPLSIAAFGAADFGSWYANVDPIISIDPSSPYADDFTIEVSAPFAVVPEPSTWAMVLLGFAGLGFAGYRTSRKAVSIAA